MPGVLRAPNLRDLRLRNRLTQKGLAEKAGVAFTSIINLEQGGAARFQTIRRLAEALDVPDEELGEPAPKGAS